MNTIAIERLDAVAAVAEVPALSSVLIDCVEGGASVSFMWPMTATKAEAFWNRVAGAVERGETLLFAARDAEGICGTVQVLLSFPENQPHRGEIAKLLVHRRARNRGIAEALMRAAEAAAIEAGKTLLVLDTASDVAERLYTRLGWQLCGTIPGYALLPGGEECATVVFWKRIAD
ncbi:MAG: GNAT family N-acetyltransferase [Dehalococcoidia bacterium]